VSPEVTELISQHVQVIQQLEQLWRAFVILVFVEIAFMGFMFALAGWSVSRVNKQQLEAITALAERQTGVETSWKEVMTLLMHMLRGMTRGNQ
jgi:hypothetical protein